MLRVLSEATLKALTDRLGMLIFAPTPLCRCSVSPSYAPPGKALVSISLVGAYPDRSDDDLQTAVEAELRDWFGKETATWRHLKTYRIPFAQVSVTPVSGCQKLLCPPV